MNARRFTIAGLFIILTAGVCLAQVDVPKTLGNVDISAVKRMQVVSTARDYSMDLQVILTNANAEALRLRNGDYDVIFDRAKEGTLLLGHTRVADQIVPGKVGQQPGSAVMPLSVLVGPQNQATVEKLIEVFNIIGDPAVPLRITIRGKSEVGLQLPRGWVYEQGRKFEVELVFTPAFQREILLK